MIDRQFLDSLSTRISQLFPRASELGEEGRDAVRQLLQKSLTELNILTREEFESRDRALKRAEDRVKELEDQLQELEHKLNQLAGSE
jgi:BMFP domain-containing protein YqiC